MASINGVQIKNITKFKGHEGEPLSQGNVYIDGKKIGFWSMGDWGGPCCYDFDETELKVRAAKAQSGFPTDYEYYPFQNDPDIFMGNLMNLMNDEKEYKKHSKAGRNIMIVVTDGCVASVLGLSDSNTSDIEKRYAFSIEKMKKNLYYPDNMAVTIYTKLEDFELVIDAEHPAPAWLCAA